MWCTNLNRLFLLLLADDIGRLSVTSYAESDNSVMRLVS